MANIVNSVDKKEHCSFIVTVLWKNWSIIQNQINLFYGLSFNKRRNMV